MKNGDIAKKVIPGAQSHMSAVPALAPSQWAFLFMVKWLCSHFNGDKSCAYQNSASFERNVPSSVKWPGRQQHPVSFWKYIKEAGHGLKAIERAGRLRKTSSLLLPSNEMRETEQLATQVQGQGTLQTPSHHLGWASVTPSINSNKDGIENSP